MTDRTRDFQSILQLYSSDNVEEKPHHHKIGNETAQFTAATSDIAKQLHGTSKRLEELVQLVKKSDLFNDYSDKINKRSAELEEEITNINMQLDNLKVYHDNTKNQTNSKQAVNHFDVILSQLKSEIVNKTKNFKSIVQVRQENLQLQQNRRSTLGKSKAVGKPQAFRKNRRNQSDLPRPPGVTDVSESSEKAPLIPHSSHGIINASNHQQQEQMIPDQSYAQSRADMAADIQTRVVEFGQAFNRLSLLIQEQGEAVQRIDDNVEDTMVNVNAGQNELIKYFASVSNNRMLMAKVTGILLIFLVFFMFFMA